MDQLPIEIFEYILDQLDLIDLLNSRLVCQKWMNIITSKKIKELNIIDHASTRKIRWFRTFRPFDYKYLIKYYQFEPLPDTIFESFLFNTMFSKLRMLNISYHLPSTFNLEIINKFDQLIQLEIFAIEIRNDPTILQLPNLRILSIENSVLVGLLKIDCPKLESFESHHFCSACMVIVNPSSIKYLSITGISDLNGLSQFVNLEIFYLFMIPQITDVAKILSLKHLKKLFIKDFDFLSNNQFIKNFFINLVEKRDQMKRYNLEISFQGRLVHTTDQIMKIEFSKEINRFEDFPKAAKELIFFSDISLATSCFLWFQNSNFSDDFFLKCNNIQVFETKGPLNKYKKEFIYVISKLKCLRGLKMVNPSIDLMDSSMFYDTITTLCSLANLTIKEQSEVGIDFIFVLKMKYLVEIDINQTLDFDLVIDMLSNSQYLDLIIFKNNDNWYQIKKFCSTRYRMKCWPTDMKDSTLFDFNLDFKQLKRMAKNLANVIITRSRKRKID